MARTEPNEKHGSLPEVDKADLLRALTVERFTAWKPPSSATDRAEMVAYPTVRDGLPFEPTARSVRAGKYRRYTAATRRSS